MSNSGAAQTGLIDWTQLDSLVSAAGIAGAAEILNAFWRSSDDLIADLSQHIEASEFHDAAAVAHALKGSAANVGANRLSEEVRNMEIACRDGNQAIARQSLANIEKLYAASRKAFADYLQNDG